MQMRTDGFFKFHGDFFFPSVNVQKRSSWKRANMFGRNLIEFQLEFEAVFFFKHTFSGQMQPYLGASSLANGPSIYLSMNPSPHHSEIYHKSGEATTNQNARKWFG